VKKHYMHCTQHVKFTTHRCLVLTLRTARLTLLLCCCFKSLDDAAIC